MNRRALIITGVLMVIGTAIVFFIINKNGEPRWDNADISDICSVINSSSFRSVEKVASGLGPGGVTMGHSSLNFKGNGFTWMYSDLVGTGTYTCQNNVVKAKWSRGGAVSAIYDNSKGILTWEGIEYRKIR